MGLVRFGVSLEDELLKKFDRLCRENNYQNRSEALRDLIRDRLVRNEWADVKGEVTAIVSIIYDHHKRELVDKLMDIQHKHQATIIASQHIHLDHDNCLEVIITKGEGRTIKDLAAQLRSTKGVKHSDMIMTTTGKAVK